MRPPSAKPTAASRCPDGPMATHDGRLGTAPKQHQRFQQTQIQASPPPRGSTNLSSLSHVRAAPFCGAGFCQRNPSSRRRAGMAPPVSLDPTQAHHVLPIRRIRRRHNGRFPSAARISRCLRSCTEEGTRRGGMATLRHRRAGGLGSRLKEPEEGSNNSIDRAR